MFGVYPKKISDAIKRFEETDEHRDRKRRGRKRTATDQAHVKEAQALLELNNHTKCRKGESDNSTRKIRKKAKISQRGPKEIFSLRGDQRKFLLSKNIEQFLDTLYYKRLERNAFTSKTHSLFKSCKF